MTKVFRGIVAVFVVTVFVWVAVPSADAAKTIRLIVGAGHPAAGSAWVQGLSKAFIPTVDKILAKSGKYKIKWTEAYAGSIAKLGNHLESIQDGVLDIGVVIYPFEASKLFPHNFTYKVPFGTCDAQIVQKAATKLHNKFPQLKQIFEKRYNQKWLGVYGSSCYGMISRFAWQGFGKLKGRKIGAAGPNLPWVTAAGAVGVATTLNLAYTSLQTGVYEALIIFIDPVGGFKLYEPAKNWIEVGFGSVAPTGLMVNLDRFKRLPKEVQGALVEGGKVWGVQSTAIGQALAKSVTAKLKGAGVNFQTVPFNDRLAWAKSMPNMPNIWAKDAVKKGYSFAPDLVRAYISELRAAGQKMPRNWKID